MAALLMGSSQIAASEAPSLPETVETAQPEVTLGRKAVATLRAQYENGKYDPFLKEMEAKYQEAKKGEALENLVSMRKPMDLKWAELSTDLEKKRSKDLASLLSEKDQDLFSQKVRNSGMVFSKEEDEAFSKVLSFRSMVPGSGQNEEENALIDIDVNYEFKMIHLGLLDFKEGAISDRQEKQYVLMMEKMDKMLEACQGFKDASLKKAVESAYDQLDARLSKAWDLKDLAKLADGKIKPLTKLEEKSASLLSSYQEKFSELSQQLTEDEAKN